MADQSHFVRRALLIAGRKTSLVKMKVIRGRVVRFALEKDYEVHIIPSRFDYSGEERSQIWLDLEDYRRISQEVKAITSAIDRRARHGKKRVLPKNECTRGLESHTRNGCVARKVAILDGLHAVLMEQDHQQNKGTFRVEAIRNRYIEMSCVSVRAARQRGEEDALYENEAETVDLPTASKNFGRIRNAPHELVNRQRSRGRIRRLLFGAGRGGNVDQFAAEG